MVQKESARLHPLGSAVRAVATRAAPAVMVMTDEQPFLRKPGYETLQRERLLLA